MLTRTLACLVLFTTAALGATDQTAKSPYISQKTRTIKALSVDEVEALLTGKGSGLAKAAELNGYPGPAHVLELAKQLHLTPEQLRQTQAIEASMRSQAKAIGADLVVAEKELDSWFASKQITDELLSASLERIGDLQSRLRKAHLEAHLKQAKLLDPVQTVRYMALRGYDDSPNHRDHGIHGHR